MKSATTSFTRCLGWVEGIVSYRPLVLHRAGLLELTPSEIDSIWDHWGFAGAVPGDDLATLEDFRPELFSLWYAKSFKLQVLLERELGLDEYRCLTK